MFTRVFALLGLIAAIALAAPTAVALPEDAETHDIVHLGDGRVLTGNLISETANTIVFEYVNARLGITTKLTLSKDDVIEIERDVAKETTEKPSKSTTGSSRGTTDRDADKPRPGRFGVGHVEDASADVVSLYVVPMKGQMGTDVNVDVYKEMIDDIKAHDPDYLIIEMECVDTEDRLYSRISANDKGFDGSTYLDMYRDLVNLFRDELRDVDQVLWVRDSVGISSVIALAWENMYMVPEAHLGGVAGAADNFAVQDAEVHAKFREGYMAWLKGFAENGGRSLQLVDAMVIPDFLLSASWKGREVNWTLDTGGHYIVDDDEEETASFRARDAEDLLLSEGTAEDLDELVLLMGYREYHMVDGAGEQIFEDYREDWRRAFDNCAEWYKDYQQFMGWATGQDELKYLGKAKSSIEKIIAAAERYKAVEIRLLTDYGIRTFDLVTIVEQLKERIRGIRKRGRGGAGGARGSGGAARGSGRAGRE